MQFVRGYPQVVGFGVWNAESPRLVDRTFIDTRRGLTSFGPDGHGGGSCYGSSPAAPPGVRCDLEQAMRQLAYARPDEVDRMAADSRFTGLRAAHGRP